jgi:hypothetical protein
MKPGRELDMLIAEKVMGYEYHPTKRYMAPKNYRDRDGFRVWDEDIPHYSTDIAAAWEVVTKLAEEGKQIRISNKAMGNNYWWSYIEEGAAQGESAPHAICLAALKALGVEV